MGTIFMHVNVHGKRERERGQWGAIVLQNEEAPAQTNGESQYSGRIRWSRKWERKTVREGVGVCLGALLILNDNTRHMQMKLPALSLVNENVYSPSPLVPKEPARLCPCLPSCRPFVKRSVKSCAPSGAI